MGFLIGIFIGICILFCALRKIGQMWLSLPKEKRNETAKKIIVLLQIIVSLAWLYLLLSSPGLGILVLIGIAVCRLLKGPITFKIIRK